jgi:hypothetical protein
MRAANTRWSLTLLVFCCFGCGHGKNQPPSQAVAPPLQTGKGTISEPDTTKPQQPPTPLASPLPPTSAQNVQLPPPPPPRKARHQKSKPKPPDTSQVAAPPPPSNVEPAPTSPIGQLTTGDSAVSERNKHETSDMISETQQGLAGIKRPLSNDEKVTATQINTYLSQAKQALDNGDPEGAHTLATKAKLLLDELTKP